MAAFFTVQLLFVIYYFGSVLTADLLRLNDLVYNSKWYVLGQCDCANPNQIWMNLALNQCCNSFRSDRVARGRSLNGTNYENDIESNPKGICIHWEYNNVSSSSCCVDKSLSLSVDTVWSHATWRIFSAWVKCEIEQRIDWFVAFHFLFHYKKGSEISIFGVHGAAKCCWKMNVTITETENKIEVKRGILWRKSILFCYLFRFYRGYPSSSREPSAPFGQFNWAIFVIVMCVLRWATRINW